MYTSMHSAGLERTELTYIRLEDNLIRRRSDRYLQVLGYTSYHEWPIFSVGTLLSTHVSLTPPSRIIGTIRGGTLVILDMYTPTHSTPYCVPNAFFESN